jgi:hypothetical protein
MKQAVSKRRPVVFLCINMTHSPETSYEEALVV